MRIDEIMSRPVVSCRPIDTLDTVIKLMLERDCGVLPVIGNDGKLSGIITDRDVCVAAYHEGQPLRAIHVVRAMANVVICARLGDTVDFAENLMAKHRIRRMPVVNETGCVVGMISLNDIARDSLRRHEHESQLAATLAAVCQPKFRLGQPSRNLPMQRPTAV